MAKYEVCIPFAGYLTGEVDAENEKEAIEIALEQCSFHVLVDDACGFECAEVDAISAISSGNVNHAPLNEASAELIK